MTLLIAVRLYNGATDSRITLSLVGFLLLQKKKKESSGGGGEAGLRFKFARSLLFGS
jgi:hypothetical protein